MKKNQEENQIIEYMNQKYAVAKLAGRAIIIQESQGDDGIEIDFINPADLKIFYQNRKILVGNESMSWAQIWLNHPARKTFEKVIFYPSANYQGDSYNLYRGLAFQAKKGKCQKFWKHIEDNICQGDQVNFHYLKCWLADCIQNPLDRKGIAIVLRGGQGTGKGKLANTFGKIFGRHFKQISNQKHLIGNFNAHLKDALFLFVDEGFWAGDKQGQGVLKSLITEENLMIEQKGKDAYMMKNYTRIMMASNEDWVAPVELDDRRYFVLDVGEEQKRNFKYFKAIDAEMESGGLEALLWELQHFKIDIDLRDIPATEGSREQKIYSFTPIQQWWFHILSEKEGYEFAIDGGNDEDIYSTQFSIPWECSSEALFQDYKNFIKEMSIKNRFSPTQFGIQIRKLIPEENERKQVRIKGKRKWIHCYKSIAECRKFFEINANQIFF